MKTLKEQLAEWQMMAEEAKTKHPFKVMENPETEEIVRVVDMNYLQLVPGQAKIILTQNKLIDVAIKALNSYDSCNCVESFDVGTIICDAHKALKELQAIIDEDT